VVFEVEGFSAKQRADKASAILKRALNPDAVIFEIPSSKMNPATAVDEIAKQIGEVAGYTNLGQFRREIKGLILEIVFVKDEDNAKAIKEGVTINGVIYQGSPWVDQARRRTVKVNLTHVPLKLFNSLGTALRIAMTPYGDVLQIRKYTDVNGRFFGEASVILDRGEEKEGKDLAELARMIYLEPEDVYMSATYQGAPKVCFHCRLAGHERQECPELASLQCYKCKGFGHLRRHCRNSARKEPVVTKINELPRMEETQEEKTLHTSDKENADDMTLDLETSGDEEIEPEEEEFYAEIPQDENSQCEVSIQGEATTDMSADLTGTKDDLQAMDTTYEQIVDEDNDPTIPPSPTGSTANTFIGTRAEGLAISSSKFNTRKPRQVAVLARKQSASVIAKPKERQKSNISRISSTKTPVPASQAANLSLGSSKGVVTILKSQIDHHE
jgi:hypothetical protein